MGVLAVFIGHHVLNSNLPVEIVGFINIDLGSFSYNFSH
jgi:hypothetical protein